MKREKQLQEDRDTQVAQLQVCLRVHASPPYKDTNIDCHFLLFAFFLPQSKVKRAVDQWMNPPSSRSGRDLAQLLCSLHTIVTYIPSPEAIWDTSSTGGVPVTLSTAKPVEVSCWVII